MLESIATGVIVGLGSGLLGSIFGPRISHGLDRQRRREIRKEERHRELRAMIDSQVRQCLHAFAGAFSLAATAHTGQPLLDAHLDHLKQRNTQEKVLWSPHRIDDSQIRSMAERLFDLRLAFDRALTDGVSALKSGPDEWSSAITALETEMRELMWAIDERMDELDW